MTTTPHLQERGDLLDIAAPEALARLAVLEARSEVLAPALRPARASGPDWDCLVHVPGASLAPCVAETLRFGGWRRRQEAAKAAYDALWAGHGVGRHGNEPAGERTTLPIGLSGRIGDLAHSSGRRGHAG